MKPARPFPLGGLSCIDKNEAGIAGQLAGDPSFAQAAPISGRPDPEAHLAPPRPCTRIRSTLSTSMASRLPDLCVNSGCDRSSSHHRAGVRLHRERYAFLPVGREKTAATEIVWENQTS
ncbi:hypothetical protein [Burkholderia stagnalis]|uniref:hypothetical protein n=1 Tax=Burkholderia stagnalis TaxID=1503054 RepID=UPI001E39A9C9|nr:hypothetical protein [Burkholderia stagnalis]